MWQCCLSIVFFLPVFAYAFISYSSDAFMLSEIGGAWYYFIILTSLCGLIATRYCTFAQCVGFKLIQNLGTICLVVIYFVQEDAKTIPIDCTFLVYVVIESMALMIYAYNRNVEPEVDLHAPFYSALQQLEVERCESSTTCTICLDDVEMGENVRVLACSHQFHPNCADPWILEHGTCPNCRSELEPNLDNPLNPTMSNMLNV